MSFDEVKAIAMRVRDDVLPGARLDVLSEMFPRERVAIGERSTICVRVHDPLEAGLTWCVYVRPSDGDEVAVERSLRAGMERIGLASASKGKAALQ